MNLSIVMTEANGSDPVAWFALADAEEEAGRDGAAYREVGRLLSRLLVAKPWIRPVTGLHEGAEVFVHAAVRKPEAFIEFRLLLGCGTSWLPGDDKNAFVERGSIPCSWDWDDLRGNATAVHLYVHPLDLPAVCVAGG